MYKWTQVIQVVLVVKNPPANTGDVRDAGSILAQEAPLEKGMATHSSLLAWRIPWTEEREGYSPWGQKELNTIDQLIHTHIHVAQNPCYSRVDCI